MRTCWGFESKFQSSNLRFDRVEALEAQLDKETKVKCTNWKISLPIRERSEILLSLYRGRTCNSREEAIGAFHSHYSKGAKFLLTLL